MGDNRGWFIMSDNRGWFIMSDNRGWCLTLMKRSLLSWCLEKSSSGE